MLDRTSIGGLLIEEAQDWAFSVQDRIIAGRFRDDSGILRMTTIAPNQLSQPVTHEECLSHCAALAEVTEKPADWYRGESGTGPYGSASFQRGSDRVFVWYCARLGGLIVGAYACAADVSRTRENRGIRARCNYMITSALFDRRIWGGDDELTRWMTALLAADDPSDYVSR
jgi:hypothetical protein